MKTIVYPGTFDPITNGHIDLVEGHLSCLEKSLLASPVTVKKPFFDRRTN